MRCVVAIPIYSPCPSSEELDSFRQCLKILGNHDIVIITFEELNCHVYDDIANQRHCHIKKVYFDKLFFGSIEGYNKLCLDVDFYNMFSDYDYMLIYQLDAWVFSDQLYFWCKKGYDFIGAPWFKTEHNKYPYEFSEFIGNGGLSLRKISFCIQALKYMKYRPILSWRGLLKMHSGLSNLPKILIKFIGIHNNRSWFIPSEDKPAINEDFFFALFKFSNMDCQFPDLKEALRFSFEVHPSYLFELNQNKLPFGCHAYRKYEYDIFWSQYIKER